MCAARKIITIALISLRLAVESIFDKADSAEFRERERQS